MKGHFNKPICAIITSIALLSLVIGLSSITSVMAGGEFPLFACSDVVDNGGNPHICKSVFITEEETVNQDAEVNEVVEFSMLITVANTSGVPWFNNIVKDNFGGQLDVTSCDNTGDGDNINVSLVTVGNSDKVKLVWTIGTLTNGQTATLDCTSKFRNWHCASTIQLVITTFSSYINKKFI